MNEKSEHFNSLRPILFELCKKKYRGGVKLTLPPPAGIGLKFKTVLDIKLYLKQLKRSKLFQKRSKDQTTYQTWFKGICYSSIDKTGSVSKRSNYICNSLKYKKKFATFWNFKLYSKQLNLSFLPEKKTRREQTSELIRKIEIGSKLLKRSNKLKECLYALNTNRLQFL